MEWSLLGFKGLSEVVNIHPVFVHFPVALFPTVLFFYFIGIVWRKEKFLFAGKISLALAVLSAIVTVWTGEIAKDSFPHSETVHQLMMTHEKIGITGLVFGSLLFLWSFWLKEGYPKGKFYFLIFLILTTLAILQNGDIGGRMVFVEGASVKSKVVSPVHHHDHSHPHPH